MDMLVALFVLGVCGSLALGNDVKSSAPEDLDGSGDDGDYSGSGFDTVDTSVKEDSTTPVSPLVSTITQLSKDKHPDTFVKVQTEEETTQVLQTTKPLEAIDELAVHPTQAGTTLRSTTQHTTTAEFIDLDASKHSHHHPHHHHHTTTQSTTVSDLDDSTDVLAGVDHVPPENPTTSVADDSEIEDLFQKVTTPFSDVVQPGVHTQETTSGSSSTPFADHEELDRESEEFPVLVNAEATTVAGSSTQGVHQHGSHHEQTTIGGGSNVHEKTSPKPTEEIEPNVDLFLQGVARTTPSDENKHHHHGHHPHHHNHTTTPNEDLLMEGVARTTPSDENKHHHGHHPHHHNHTTTPNEDLFMEGVPSTTPSDENKHHHHGHHPHHHNHTTTPSATVSTDADKPHVAHTHVPKGRNANVPLAKSTTAIPILNEEEHVPEDVEPSALPTISTVQPTTSAIPVQDENDDSLDSKEDIGSSGDGSDFFIEATVPVIKQDRANQPSDGSSDASHGIMERKELLAGIIAGGLAGLVFAAALVAFVLYRMKKKDEGSYSLEEPKQSNGGYQKPKEQREFYA